jgi:hypothetical protein
MRFLKELIERSSNSSEIKDRLKATFILLLIASVLPLTIWGGYIGYNELRHSIWIKNENHIIFQKCNGNQYCITRIDSDFDIIPKSDYNSKENCYCIISFEDYNITITTNQKEIKTEFDFIDYKTIRIENINLLNNRLNTDFEILITPGGDLVMNNEQAWFFGRKKTLPNIYIMAG